MSGPSTVCGCAGPRGDAIIEAEEGALGTHRRAGTRRAAALLAAALWLGALLFSFATLVFLNDHFGRISPARQIARYGELPFRDFLDPGYFMTELASASLLWLFGDNLLGEAIIVTTAVATGTLLVFLMAARLTASRVAALVAALLALLLLPRAYDYDKVLFYPLGLYAVWRYVDRPQLRRLWAIALVLVAAALFRYDSGAYIGLCAVVMMAVIHATDWRTFSRRVGALVMAVVCLSAPFALFVQFNDGVGNAVDQMVAYGQRETARTRLPPQRLSVERLADIAPAPASTDAAPSVWTRAAGAIPLLRLRLLPGAWTTANADAVLAWVFRYLPLAAAIALVIRARRRRVPLDEVAQVAGLITMCACLNVFILRDPIGARVGGIAGPAVILSAWVARIVWQARTPAIRPVGRLAVLSTLALVVWAASRSVDWDTRLKREMIRPAHLQRQLALIATTPPTLDLYPSAEIRGLVAYARECTAPTDRLLATWFVPDLYFYAQRGFAAGIVALFGGHWSEPRFEARSLDILKAQSVPIVITKTGDEAFADMYPLLAAHLAEHYRPAGRSDFADPRIGPEGYTVLVRTDRTASRTFADTSLPCFW